MTPKTQDKPTDVTLMIEGKDIKTMTKKEVIDYFKSVGFNTHANAKGDVKGVSGANPQTEVVNTNSSQDLREAFTLLDAWFTIKIIVEKKDKEISRLKDEIERLKNEKVNEHGKI